MKTRLKELADCYRASGHELGEMIELFEAENDRLQEIVRQVQNELDGFEQLESAAGLHETLDDIQTVLSKAAADAAGEE